MTDRRPAPLTVNPAKPLDVVGIGNALVDFITDVEDSVIDDLELVKGSMNLIDEDDANRLGAAIPPDVSRSGGSAANTVVGVCEFGGTAALIAKVSNDITGRVFTEDLRAVGVRFDPRPAAPGGAGSGRCVVLVTPDGERTLNTFLGISTTLGPDDVDEALIGEAKVVYLEGYLWDLPEAKEALRRAARAARAGGGRVALSLSDSFCVDRHRESFLELIHSDVDLLFANEAEIRLLVETDSSDEAVDRAEALGVTAALTFSERGSIILSSEGRIAVPATPVARVVDTTGAGDLYAAGFLFGLTHGLELDRCAALGALAAAEIISHLGARPDTPLRALAEQASLLPPP